MFSCTVFIIYLWRFQTVFKDVRSGLAFQFFDKVNSREPVLPDLTGKRVSLTANTFLSLPTLGLSAFSARG